MPLMNNFQAYINNLIRYFPSCVYLEKVFIEAKKNYEKAIMSYQKAKKIYPTMKSPDIMIKQLKELIQKESI